MGDTGFKTKEQLKEDRGFLEKIEDLKMARLSSLGAELNTTTWETTVDSDNTSSANTDFILTDNIADLTNYKNASSVISCRVYQEAI